MARIKDARPGLKFARLTILRQTEDRLCGGRMRHFFLCQCDCGKTVEVMVDSLGKNVVSCGCKKQENLIRKHGLYKHRLFNIWRNMRQRCTNSKNPNYKFYGALGIKVCPEWEVFTVFYDWAMSHGYKDNLTIDRLDYDGNYEPSNCQWITIQEQNMKGKKRENTYYKYIAFHDKRLCMKEWSENLNGCRQLVWARIKRGWSMEDAITRPVRRKQS